MAPVLAQVGGDAVGAGIGDELRRAHRIGMVAAARVPDRRDVVDVDAEAQPLSRCGAAPGLDRRNRREFGRQRIRRISRDIDRVSGDERDAEVGPAARAVDQAAAATPAAGASTAAIASREDRPVVTMSSTISTRVAGLEAEAAAKLERALRPLDEHRRLAQRAAHFVADDHPAHRRRDDDVDLLADLGRELAASARASRSARAGSISTRAHCR